MQREILKLIGEAIENAVASEIQRSKKVERQEVEKGDRDRDTSPEATPDEW